MHIVLFCPIYSSRLAYVLQILFEHLCPHSYEWVYDKNAYVGSFEAKINYSATPIDPNELWIRPESLLFESTIQPYPIQTKWVEGCPWLNFGSSDTGQLPADVFAGSFYMLSRYEEYLPFAPDRFGRFTAAVSLAKREGFLHLAVVQRWLLALFQNLQQRNPGFSWQALPYSFAPTYDIDMPWAFCFRPWWKQLGGAGKDVLLAKRSRLKDRLKAWLNPREDPFFSFAQLQAWHEKFHLKPRFFFLVGDSSKYDTNPSHQLSAQQALIQGLSANYPIGLHPSYWSNTEPERVGMEKNRLKSISGQSVLHSRQHFLKLRFPETYRQLIAAGIKADFSMGFSDDTGFRAGTAVPYPWYDLEKETCTELMIHPFVAMDVTMQQYLGLNAQQALKRIQTLHTEVHSLGGPLCLLWHNSSFYAEDGWRGWKEAYEGVLEICSTDDTQKT